MADGGKVKGNNMIKYFSWLMQGLEFTTYVILFPLVIYDLILGMQWLRTLGPITWDCHNLTMEFVKDNKKVQLNASKSVKSFLLTTDKDLKTKEQQAFMLQISPLQANLECYTLKMNNEASDYADLELLLEGFKELFDKP